MKNLKRIVFGILAMLVMVTSVNAEEADTFKQCLDSESSVCELTKPYELTADINVTRELKIDLKGNNVDFNGHRIKIENGGKLTLVGGGAEIDATKTTNKTIIWVGEGTYLNIDDVTVKATTVAPELNLATIGIDGKTTETTVIVGKDAVITGHNTAVGLNPTDGVASKVGNVNITINGTLKSTGNAITVNGMALKPDYENVYVVVNINKDATITSDSAAGIYAAGYAVWNINGATITGGDAINVRSGKVVIDGGTYTATADNSDSPTAAVGSAEIFGSAISIMSSNKDAYPQNVELTVKGGTFVSQKGSAVNIYKHNDGNQSQLGNPKIAINGGDFTAAVEDVVKLTNTESEVEQFINGGTYKTTAEGKNPKIPEKSVNEEYENYVDENGNTVLGELYTVNIGKFTVSDNVVTKPTVELKFPAGKEIDLRDVICKAGKNCTKNSAYKLIYSGDLSGTNTFVMPEKDITLDIEAVKRVEYTLTVNEISTLGDVKLKDFATVFKNQIKEGKVLEGEELDLTKLFTNPEDAETYAITYTGTVSGIDTFTMPESDAELSIKVVKRADLPKEDEPSQPSNPEADGNIVVGETQGDKDVVLSEADSNTLRESLAATTDKELQALLKDKDVTVELEAKEVAKESLAADEVEKFEKVVAGANVVEFFDLNILVKADGVDNHYLRELSKPITLTIDLPELPALKDGYTRKYYIIREHNGVYEKIDATLKDGKLSFASDKFSKYALAYVDEKATVVNPTDDETNENPSTLDSIVSIVTLAISSLGTAGYSIKKFIRK